MLGPSRRSAMTAHVACHECAATYRKAPLQPGQTAACRRCGTVLYRRRHRPLSRGIAFLAAALMFWVLTHVFPLVTLSLEGTSRTATVLTGVAAIADAGLWPLALMVLGFVSVIPGLKIATGLVAGIAAARHWRDPLARRVWGMSRAMTRWAMLEIYLLGVFVAYVKLVDYARIGLEPGLVTLVLCMLCLAAADVVMDPETVWSRIGRPNPPSGHARAGIACHRCTWVAPEGRRRCPRCDEPLHARKPQAVQRTWALLAAAIVLYVPANVYPIMVITQLGRDHATTILAGVVDLVAAGMYPIAAIVFVASVVVPVAKIAGMIWLLVAAQRRSRQALRSRTKAYTVIELVGRWSMVDVFMVAILASLVNVGGLLVIKAGVGAFAFAAVVILTMLASASFDPRLAWDEAGVRHDRV
jgi:paraquat-inducible protein A